MYKHRITAILLSFLLAVPMLPDPLPTSGEELPAAFDLRNEGLVSAVKEQGAYGTDWAFSAMNALETSQIARQPLIDLSEWHLAYYTHCSSFGYPAFSESVFAERSSDVRQEAGLLTGWVGAVSEEACPYGNTSSPDGSLSIEDVRMQSEYHVTAAISYPYRYGDASFSEQMQAVKEAVYSGHALDARYTESESCYQAQQHAYYYDPVSADDATESRTVSIVGWDDSYPSGNFTTDPGTDGAWLVKNSLGTEWGEYGYFWLSYADTSLTDITAFEAEPAAPDMRLYQHDDYGNSGSFAVDPEGDTSVYAANVFTAEKDGWVNAVMLCNMQADTAYEITVYTGLTEDTSPVSGTASGITATSLHPTGYQTVTLTEPVFVQGGEKFSVVAHISGEQGYLIPCEYASRSEWTNPDGSADYSDSVFTMEMLYRDFNAGESFYSTEGTAWTDMFDREEACTEFPSSVYRMREGNICLKAVTRDAYTVTFSDYHDSLPLGDEITLSVAEDADIYYSVNGGDYTLYAEPIPFTEEMTVSAYADTGEHIVYTQHYSVQNAAISSLLCVTDTTRYAESIQNTYYLTISGPRETIRLMPISTGTVRCGEQVLPSGELTEINVGGQSTLELTVTKDGLQTAVYYLVLEEPQPDQIGDVNLDGFLDAADAAEILIYAAAKGSGIEPELPDADWLLRADYNSDGIVDAADSADILVYAAEEGAK